MSVLTQIVAPVNEVYRDPAFLRVIEDHLEWLRNHETTDIRAISSGENDRCFGNMSRLLGELKVEYDIHHIVARVNGYQSTEEYDGELTHIYIPNVQTITQLMGIHLTAYKMI